MSCFGSVVTTEAHLAFAGAKVHSLCHLLSWAHGPVGTLVFPMIPSMLPVFCLGTILARTHVQFGLFCQKLLLNVQHRQRCTMQYVHSHAENLRNECVDHAAALATRWAHHSFDSLACFSTCRNLGDILETLCDSQAEHVSASQHLTRRWRSLSQSVRTRTNALTARDTSGQPNRVQWSHFKTVCVYISQFTHYVGIVFRMWIINQRRCRHVVTMVPRICVLIHDGVPHNFLYRSSCRSSVIRLPFSVLRSLDFRFGRCDFGKLITFGFVDWTLL